VATSAKKPRNLKLSLLISVSLSIAIIVILLWFTLTDETLDQLASASIRYEFFIAAILVNIVYWSMWGARLKVLSDAVDKTVHISWWEATKIVIANLFLASITPSMAGGEPVRIHLLTRDGLSTGSATASVLGERLLDVIFLLVAVPFAFYVFKDRIEMQLISYGLTIGIIVFAVAIILFAYAIRFPEKTKGFLVWLNIKINRLLKRPKEKQATVVTRINTEVDNFHESMVFFLTKGRRSFLGAGLLTVVFWLTGFLIPSLILLGLGLGPHFLESYAAQVLLIIIVMMPTTPGSAGVTEGGAAALYSVFIGTSFLGIFVLLFRFITYHMNLIGGAIFQYKIFRSLASLSLDNSESSEK